MKHLQNPCLEPDQKLVCLKITIAFAFFCGFGPSWRLWVSSRQFPLSPISDSLPIITFPFDLAWFILLFGLLLGIIIASKPRILILTFLVLAGILSSFDQMRWQPWFYQYFFMMAALGFYAWKKPEVRNNQTALKTCRFVVIFTYVWSGIQKLNVNFVTQTWPDLAGPFLGLLPEGVKKLPSFLILMIPLLETSIGLGLLTRKYRNTSVILAIATHGFVLLVLFTSGENTIVWPWNIAMALFVLILFWQDSETSPRKVLLPTKLFHTLVLVLFGVLPVFSLIGLWDSYLSSALYSGNTEQAVIYLSPATVERLPSNLHQYIWQHTEPFFLDINRWAYGELNVPVYPESRIFKKVAIQVCSLANGPPDIKLRITSSPNPLTGLRESAFYDCEHLYTSR
ncbi:MAG: hypothetical protein AABN95_08175 [Acidobacteriota bacterium]